LMISVTTCPRRTTARALLMSIAGTISLAELAVSHLYVVYTSRSGMKIAFRGDQITATEVTATSRRSAALTFEGLAWLTALECECLAASTTRMAPSTTASISGTTVSASSLVRSRQFCGCQRVEREVGGSAIEPLSDRGIGDGAGAARTERVRRAGRRPVAARRRRASARESVPTNLIHGCPLIVGCGEAEPRMCRSSRLGMARLESISQGSYVYGGALSCGVVTDDLTYGEKSLTLGRETVGRDKNPCNDWTALSALF
jgi:hypothetical protein